MSPKAASALQAANADPHLWAMADCPEDMLACFAEDAKAERRERLLGGEPDSCRLLADVRAIRRALRSLLERDAA